LFEGMTKAIARQAEQNAAKEASAT